MVVAAGTDVDVSPQTCVGAVVVVGGPAASGGFCSRNARASSTRHVSMSTIPSAAQALALLELHDEVLGAVREPVVGRDVEPGQLQQLLGGEHGLAAVAPADRGGQLLPRHPADDAVDAGCWSPARRALAASSVASSKKPGHRRPGGP